MHRIIAVGGELELLHLEQALLENLICPEIWRPRNHRQKALAPVGQRGPHDELGHYSQARATNGIAPRQAQPGANP